MEWEYQVKWVDSNVESLEMQLNFLGDERWELVAVVKDEGEYDAVRLFLKRPKA